MSRQNDPAGPLKIFFSYSRRNENMRERLEASLGVFKLQGLISNWSDQQILPGEDWNAEIEAELRSADLILLLLSADFVNSRYCNLEMSIALERHNAGQARVIPILLSPVVGFELLPVSSLQVLPTKAKPVTDWRRHDDAFADIARGIQSAIGSHRINPTFQFIEPTTGMRPPEPGAEAGARGGMQAQVRDGEDEALPFDYFFLNHTSYIPENDAEWQRQIRARTGVDADHYRIRVVLDSYYEGALRRVERVVYILAEEYPEPVQVRTDAADKFMLKEAANGEYVLMAEVYLKNRKEPIPLQRYITLWKNGPRLQ